MNHRSNFCSYIQYHFIFRDIFIKSIGSERPQVLILYNHASHVSPNVVDIAFDSGRELYFLPADTSHFLQPMDQTFFVLKSKFSNLAYSSLVMRLDLCVSKRTLTSFLKYSFKGTWEGGQLLREAFKRTGVNPTTIDGIDKSKVLWKKGMFQTAYESNGRNFISCLCLNAGRDEHPNDNGFLWN